MFNPRGHKSLGSDTVNDGCDGLVNVHTYQIHDMKEGVVVVVGA